MSTAKLGVTYVADIGQDIDDLVTAYVLRDLGVLDALVPDPSPSGDAEEAQRVDRIVEDGFPVRSRIPSNVTDILVGGALGKVAKFLEAGGHIDHLVMNGGFAGANIVAKKALRKFRNKVTARTYNFNLNVTATTKVLSAGPNEVGTIMLVGKNVCHSPVNTATGIWRDSIPYLRRFGVGAQKRLHDLLMACEGLVELGLIDAPSACNYEELYPFTAGLHGTMTRWGSSRRPTGYRRARVATGWVDDPSSWDIERFMA